MVRLSAELVQKCPQYMNPLKEREVCHITTYPHTHNHLALTKNKTKQVDLRGHKIPEIENLGVLMDQFDSVCRFFPYSLPHHHPQMDISDNDISVLGNVPVMKRLRTIIIHNNRLDSVASGLCHCLPNVRDLMMHNNHFKTFQELEPLADLPSLERVSLLDNHVAKLVDYRLFVISRLPKLKQLDFQKVSEAERAAALAKFGKASAPAPLANMPAPGLTAANRERAEQLIKNATSLEALKRIEEKEVCSGPLHGLRCIAQTTA